MATAVSLRVPSMMTTMSKCCSHCGALRFQPSLNRAKSVRLHRAHQSIRCLTNNLDAHGSANRIESETSKWKAVVGLEIHAQISSRSKLFSGAGTKYGASTNSQVAFFDAALPGTLPVLNRRCVEAGLLTALALNCSINRKSKFDRKHYFYADMPAGYQITQQRTPLAVDGHMTYVYQSSRSSHIAERRRARVLQLQLEQDSGKSLHDPELGLSLIDLNRAGVGLMEIVTAPDFVDGDDAASFVRDLRDTLMTVGSCDGKMAEGSMRVDANVSLHRPGDPLGVRSEVKNLNSFRSLRLAIDYEIQRQTQVLDGGGVVVNETRSFDLDSGETVAMRDKEKVLDYRFMPEPNLPPLVIRSRSTSTDRPDSTTSPGGSREDLLESTPGPSQDPHAPLNGPVYLEDVQNRLPELPEQTRQRLEETFGQSLQHAVILVRCGLAPLLERLVCGQSCSPAATSHVLRTCLHPVLEQHKVSWDDSPLSEHVLAEVIQSYHNQMVSGFSLMTLLQHLMAHPAQPVQAVIEELGLRMTTDTALISHTIDQVFSRNPKIIKAYRKGKTNQLQILVGKVLKKLDNKADAKTVQRLVKEKLHQS